MAGSRTPASAHESRRQLVDLIVKHDGAPQAAHAAVSLAEELLGLMRQEPDPDRQREHAGMIDARTGDQIGPITAGTRRGVGFEAQLEAARSRSVQSAIAVHTHPGSSSFSEGDAAAFAQAPLVRLLVVAGADGSWFVLSLEPGAVAPGEEEIDERYATVLEHLAADYRAMVNDGILTPDRAWQELTHETWEVIAPGLGLRYDRVKPGSGGS